MIFRSLALLGHHMFVGLAGLIGITFLIGIHELGHFLFCKLFRIHTPTFSIGFGPQLISKRWKSTTFALSAIPLGGYVEIAGLAEMGQGEQKEAVRADEFSFARKPYWQKLLVLSAGILSNLLFAYLALILLFFFGIPKADILYPRNANTTISVVYPDTPAEKSQLAVGDELMAVNGIDLHHQALRLMELIAPQHGKEITLTICRQGTIRDIPITLGQGSNALGAKIGILGVKFNMVSLKAASLWDAIKDGIALTNTCIASVIYTFKYIFTKRDMSSMGGPVQIISEMSKGAGQSFAVFVLILTMISINLAVLNLLPLPILDGGQIFYFTIEAIIRRPIPLKVREYIHLGSWLLVLSLILYLSAKDVYRLFKPWCDKIIHVFSK